MVWNQFYDRVLRIRIELRDQNDVQKSTFFNGLESVLGSGFKAFVLNYVFKTGFKRGSTDRVVLSICQTAKKVDLGCAMNTVLKL